MQNMQDIFAPFEAGESACLWLAGELSLCGLTRRAMYALNITEQVFSKHIQDGKAADIIRRMPQDATLWGNQERNGKAVQAALLLRGNAGAGGPHPVDADPSQTQGLIPPAALLEAWARKAGWWSDDVDGELGKAFPYISEGGEAKVFRLSHDSVVKRITAPGAGGVQILIDRITLHNALFPDTWLTVLGFGRGPEGNISVVVGQPYVRGSATNIADTALMVTDAGFHLIDGVRVPYTFFTGEYCLGDLHERNVLTDEDGEMHVIDCDVRLNEPQLGYAGEWTVPQVEGDEEAVRQIGDVLCRIVPQSAPREAFIARYGEQCPNMRSQLESEGRYNGCVLVRREDGSECLVIVQDDPEVSGNVLVMECEAARALLQSDDRFTAGEKARLATGFAVQKAGCSHVLDLDTGSVRGRGPVRLKEELGEEQPRRKTRSGKQSKIREEEKAPALKIR